MFAALSALSFTIALVLAYVERETRVDFVILGLLLLALHFAVPLARRA